MTFRLKVMARKALALAAAVAVVVAMVVPLADHCEEDESCWDCATMGNRVCGPVVEAGPVR